MTGEHQITLRRDNVRIRDVLELAWHSLSVNLGKWILITLAFLGLGYGGTALLQGALAQLFGAGEPSATSALAYLGTSLVTGAIASLWLGVLGLGYWATALRSVLGLPFGLRDLFSQLKKAIKYAVQTFFVQTITGAFMVGALVVVIVALLDMVDVTTMIDMPLKDIQAVFTLSLAADLARRTGWIVLLLGLPLVFVWLGLFFAQVELTYNDDAGAVGSIRNAWRISSKKRLKLFGLFCVLALCLFAGSVPCFLGLPIAIPFGTLASASMYLALRNGAAVPDANTASTLQRL